MKRGLTAKDFLDWQTYAALKPWVFNPELRADFRAASIRETIYNVNVTKKEHLKPVDHFRLKFEEETEKQLQKATKRAPKKLEVHVPERTQTLNQQWQILQVLAAMHANEP